MDIQITPSPLSGTVTPPPSKSMAHRLLLATALADGVSSISGAALSQDIEATLRCMAALGARWERTGDRLSITGIGGRRNSGTDAQLPRFDCGESGSTLRFLIPVALAVAGGGVFTGRGRLMERPQTPYFDLFAEKGISYRLDGGALTVQGRLTPGEYRLPGNVSSQFFSGLLFALPLLDGPSTVVSTTALESADYLAMTRQAMELSGVPTEAAERRFTVSPHAYAPFNAAVEADWSQAAFWYAAAFLDNAVVCSGLNPDTAQGDRIVGDLYWKLARPGTDLEIDLSGCPDLLPPLAVMAAARKGDTQFTGAARLRLKESDRLTTTAAMLTALGADAVEQADGLTVRGGKPLCGGTVDGANDHRIVMAAAIAATRAQDPVTIRGAEAVAKSYPDFWEVYQELGGDIHVL
ncbi:3-phosphoshikimate 1-carboxyvinyltransferase [Oscillibacter sp.]|uniref:3-phosphoshikimate 1-carboxyvinyltransferase n=1 Tax=Oscillibacter sp. TaxID=1945593 RepID=UPI00260B82B1|nr:3-phosphoshikimate 1-carboxyvinyltransferase [Oscillibacter sp.]MDD3346426.1 3-phosphoshikimate 1-carboxyvinyltransferase [Oscillibacter sp.]